MHGHSLLRPAGVVIITIPGRPTIEADTKQCPHCGGHWVHKPGSGRPHVFCRRCAADTCSQPMCLRECYPEEKRLDDIERHGKLILP